MSIVESTMHPVAAAVATPAHAPFDTRAAWDRIAPLYDRTNTPTQMWLGHEGLRRAGVGPGVQFVDVAAGSGALSIPAARLSARVLATDQSALMLELLRQRARDEGLDIETRVMDGHALELGDAQYDVAGSQFGVMLFPDMPRGIREIARVVKPGGRVLVTAYGDPHRIDFLGFFVSAIQAVRPDFSGPPIEPPPLPFQLQDPARLREVLAAAGLTRVRVETITETTRFGSGTQLWEWLTGSNPIVETVLEELALTAEERSSVVQALERLVRERADASGSAALSNPVHIGTGIR